MDYVLFFAAILAVSGPSAQSPRGFNTLEECQTARTMLKLQVAKYNSKADNKDKIVAFAAECVKMKPAKQGI